VSYTKIARRPTLVLDSLSVYRTAPSRGRRAQLASGGRRDDTHSVSAIIGWIVCAQLVTGDVNSAGAGAPDHNRTIDWEKGASLAPFFHLTHWGNHI
jgi:hypothetical protein